LNGVLHAAQLPPPYVLVGHSFGGLIARAYAITFPAEVAGLVLVDGLSAREWAFPDAARRRMLRDGQMFSLIGATLAAIGFVRLCLTLVGRGATAGPRAVLRSFGSGANSTVQRIVAEVSKMPRELWPYVRAYWSMPASFRTMARYFIDLPRSSAEMLAAPALPHVPLIVISAATRDPQRAQWQRELAGLCSGAEHLVIPDCGHWIQLDRPDLVVSAVGRLMGERLGIRDWGSGITD
jgi:pimeloyl-ACP methyl ester carboxylesterase